MSLQELLAVTALLSPCGMVRQKLKFFFLVFASNTAIGEPLLSGADDRRAAPIRVPRVAAVEAMGSIHHILGQQVRDTTVRQYLECALGDAVGGSLTIDQCITVVYSQPTVTEALRLQSSTATHKDLCRHFSLNSTEEEESSWQ